MKFNLKPWLVCIYIYIRYMYIQCTYTCIYLYYTWSSCIYFVLIGTEEFLTFV